VRDKLLLSSEQEFGCLLAVQRNAKHAPRLVTIARIAILDEVVFEPRIVERRDLDVVFQQGRVIVVIFWVPRLDDLRYQSSLDDAMSQIPFAMWPHDRAGKVSRHPIGTLLKVERDGHAIAEIVRIHERVVKASKRVRAIVGDDDELNVRVVPALKR